MNVVLFTVIYEVSLTVFFLPVTPSLLAITTLDPKGRNSYFLFDIKGTAPVTCCKSIQDYGWRTEIYNIMFNRVKCTKEKKKARKDKVSPEIRDPN